MHQVETLVDVIEAHSVGDHRVDLDLAVHVPIDDLWNVRTPRAPPNAVPRQTTARDQLEWTGANFGTRGRHADDDAFAPTFVRRLKRCAHHVDVAGGVERVVCAAFGQGDQVCSTKSPSTSVRVHKIGHAKASSASRLLLCRRSDQRQRSGRHRPDASPWITFKPMPPKPNTIAARADFHFGRVDHRTDARGYAAADVANLVERGVFAHFGQRDFGHNRVVGKGRAAHVVQDWVAIESREPRRAVGH